MEITLGLHAPFCQGADAQAWLGQPRLGCAALLSLLETHLGLLAPQPTQTERVAAYLVCLRQADHEHRFFHASLQVDEAGAAAELLQWRDEWRLGGWAGGARPQDPARLQDMAAVEQHAAAGLPWGQAERLAAVAAALDRRGVPIASLLLQDPLEAFPWAWQQVIRRLPWQAPAAAAPGATGALARLQQAMLDAVGARQLRPTAAPDDGSLEVVQADTREAAEHWLAARCRRQPLASRLLLAEAEGARLDDTLSAQGLASGGQSNASALRPVLQALGLALECLWDPPDPQRTLEFLNHRFGPFRRAARQRLAEVFVRHPGIGGPAWKQACERIALELDASLVEEAQLWLASDRWPRDAGAPVAVVLDRVRRLGAAFQARLARLPEEAPALGPALGQCRVVEAALQSLADKGLALVRPRLLEQLVAQASAGVSNPLARAEVGSFVTASTPGACSAATVDEVIWWMPSTPRLPAPLPWTPSEQAALRAWGTQLRDPARELAALVHEWLRPLLAARRGFVLVLPPPGQEEHPFWQLLQAVCQHLKVVSVHAAADLQQPVPAAPLPRLEPQWQLPDSPARLQAFPLPTRADRTSFSALNVLFNHPALAVLRDVAALRTGKVLALGHPAQLLGTLAHRVVEQLLAEAAPWTWTAARVAQWYAPVVDDLLRREGLPLRAPGAGLQQQQFRQTCLAGVTALMGQLRQAGVVRVESERALQGSFAGVPLTGSADLLLHWADGSTAILDLKWKRSKYFREGLQSGDYLQLALYADMLAQELGRPPRALGYFTFLDGVLVTQAEGVFGPTAVVVPPGAPPAHLLQQAAASWHWRRQQWQAGQVDVVDERVMDFKELEVPEGCMAIRPLGPWFGEYQALLGFEA